MTVFLAAALLSAPALAQFPGQLPSGQVWGNAGASRAPAAPASITAMFDRAFCATSNSMLFRGAGTWACQPKTTIGIRVSVMDPAFGAVCDGVTNDAAAINAALAVANVGLVMIPAQKTCVAATQISIPSNVTLWGYGATLKKGGNVDLVTMAGGAEIHGLTINGNGSVFTGKGVVITAGNDQKLYDLQFTDVNGFAVDVNNDVGLRLSIVNGFYQRTTVTNPAIRFANGGPQETNGDRLIQGVYCGGGWLVDTAGSQNTRLIGNDCVNFTSGANSAKTIILGNRWATVAAAITLAGTQHNVTGNTIDGNIVLAAGAQNIHIGANVLASGSLVVDNSGNTTNEYNEQAPPLGGNCPTAQPTNTTLFYGAGCGGAGAASSFITNTFAGQVSTLTVNVDNSPGAAQTYVATLWISGASTLTCTISTGQTTCSDTTHNAAAAPGNQLGLRLVSSNGAATTGVSWNARVSLH